MKFQCLFISVLTHSSSGSDSRSTSPEFESRMEYITAFGGNEDDQASKDISAQENKPTSDAKNASCVRAATHSNSNHVRRKTSRDRKHDHGKVRSRDRSHDSSRKRRRGTRWTTSDCDAQKSSPSRKHRYKHQQRHSPTPGRTSRDCRRSPTSGRSSRDHQTARHRHRKSYSRSHSRSRYNSGT